MVVSVALVVAETTMVVLFVGTFSVLVVTDPSSPI